MALSTHQQGEINGLSHTAKGLLADIEKRKGMLSGLPLQTQASFLRTITREQARLDSINTRITAIDPSQVVKPAVAASVAPAAPVSAVSSASDAGEHEAAKALPMAPAAVPPHSGAGVKETAQEPNPEGQPNPIPDSGK